MPLGGSPDADIVVSADGRTLYTVLRDSCCPTGDAIDVYARDTGGWLTRVQRIVSGPGFLVNAHLAAIAGDGAHLYVGSESAIAIFQRDALSGELAHVGTVRDAEGGVEYLDGLIQIVLAPDGGHLYASSGSNDAITVFARNLASGALSVVQVVVNGIGGVAGMDGAYPMAFSPDGAHLYVLGRAEDSIAVFDRDPSTGALGFVEAVPLGPIGDLSPAGVNVSPDGSHVYVDVFTPQSIFVLERATPSGTLTHLATQVIAIEYSPLVFGPDPAVAYDRRANVFRRDGSTGLLSLEQDNEALWSLFPHALTVAPDGRNVYATGHENGGIRVLQRVDLRCSAAPLAGCRRPTRPGAGALKISRAAGRRRLRTLPLRCGNRVPAPRPDAVARRRDVRPRAVLVRHGHERLQVRRPDADAAWREQGAAPGRDKWRRQDRREGARSERAAAG